MLHLFQQLRGHWGGKRKVKFQATCRLILFGWLPKSTIDLCPFLLVCQFLVGFAACPSRHMTTGAMVEPSLQSTDRLEDQFHGRHHSEFILAPCLTSLCHRSLQLTTYIPGHLFLHHRCKLLSPQAPWVREAGGEVRRGESPGKVSQARPGQLSGSGKIGYLRHR
jgi:hypothetical protein